MDLSILLSVQFAFALSILKLCYLVLHIHLIFKKIIESFIIMKFIYFIIPLIFFVLKSTLSDITIAPPAVRMVSFCMVSLFPFMFKPFMPEGQSVLWPCLPSFSPPVHAASTVCGSLAVQAGQVGGRPLPRGHDRDLTVPFHHPAASAWSLGSVNGLWGPSHHACRVLTCPCRRLSPGDTRPARSLAAVPLHPRAPSPSLLSLPLSLKCGFSNLLALFFELVMAAVFPVVLPRT